MQTALCPHGTQTALWGPSKHTTHSRWRATSNNPLSSNGGALAATVSLIGDKSGADGTTSRGASGSGTASCFGSGRLCWRHGTWGTDDDDGSLAGGLASEWLRRVRHGSCSTDGVSATGGADGAAGPGAFDSYNVSSERLRRDRRGSCCSTEGVSVAGRDGVVATSGTSRVSGTSLVVYAEAFVNGV